VAAGLDIVLAGDDFADEQEYGDACRKAAADLGPSVKLIGHQADLLPLYTKATILVLPSRIEGLGRVRAEAMAAGCPVISFDVCSSEELLGGGVGIVVPQGDWDALTQAILRTASDPEELEKLSVQSRRRAEELFRLEQVVRHYEQGLDQMRER
jgi:glycosyltransferase involved in cell wall biosynthesis